MSTSNSFSDMKIEEYVPGCFVLLGNTRFYKEDIKKLGGKFNSNLKCGPAWVFKNSEKEIVQQYLKRGVHISSIEQIESGEILTKLYKEKQQINNYTNTVDKETSNNSNLLNRLNSFDKRLLNIELLLNKILDIKNTGFINKVKPDNIVFDSEDLEVESLPKKRLLR